MDAPNGLLSERILEAADRVLNLALDLVDLALRLQLGVTDSLTDRLLDLSFDRNPYEGKDSAAVSLTTIGWPTSEFS